MRARHSACATGRCSSCSTPRACGSPSSCGLPREARGPRGRDPPRHGQGGQGAARAGREVGRALAGALPRGGAARPRPSALASPLPLAPRARPMTRQRFWQLIEGYGRKAGHPLAPDAARPAARLRDAPARARRRPAGAPDDARPRRHRDDPDLHAASRGPACGGSTTSSTPGRRAAGVRKWADEGLDRPGGMSRAPRAFCVGHACTHPSRLVPGLALALALASVARAELIVFEDGRVVKAAGYQLFSEELEIRSAGRRELPRRAGEGRPDRGRRGRGRSVVVEPDAPLPGGPFDLSYRRRSQAPLRHAVRRAHRARGEGVRRRRGARLGADPRRVELRAARRLAQGRPRPDAADARDREAALASAGRSTRPRT